MSGDLKTCGETDGTEPAPATRLSLGEWCVRQGLATREEIEACLREQRRRNTSGAPVRMGELLVERGILTRTQVARGLADQNEEIRQCLHCDIRVNVPLRRGEGLYRCPRCERPLAPGASGGPLDAVFDPPVVLDGQPIPDEVQRASSDPTRRFGKYVLLREAGRGGVGRVYRAWDTYLGQIVALKRLLGNAGGPASELDTAHVQSLIQEARSAIRLRHSGIVSVFDVGRVDREYYVSMEFIDGETLHDRMTAARRRGRISCLYEDLPGSLRILAEVARAVHHAHTRPTPIIHCDLKPGNILIDREGHAHVVDFGLARTVQPETKEPGQISGTPSYMAPEQASGRNDRIDPRTDVYALGAILYEMLTGRPPFVGMTLEVLDRILIESPVAPAAVRPPGRDGATLGVPADRLAFLDALCLRCLGKERSERPRDLEEVALTLESLPECVQEMAGSPETPLSAPVLPEPTPRPLDRRSLRRSGWAAAAALSLLCAFLTGLIVQRSWTGSAERRIAGRIGQFMPERALEEGVAQTRVAGTTAPETGPAVLLEEALRVAALKNRLCAALPGRADVLPLLECSGDAVDSAGPEGLRIREGGRFRIVSWNDLDPVRMAALIERAIPDFSPSDRFALGLYLLRASKPVEAARQLALLRNTPLGTEAGRYLYGLDR